MNAKRIFGKLAELVKRISTEELVEEIYRLAKDYFQLLLVATKTLTIEQVEGIKLIACSEKLVLDRLIGKDHETKITPLITALVFYKFSKEYDLVQVVEGLIRGEIDKYHNNELFWKVFVNICDDCAMEDVSIKAGSKARALGVIDFKFLDRSLLAGILLSISMDHQVRPLIQQKIKSSSPNEIRDFIESISFFVLSIANEKIIPEFTKLFQSLSIDNGSLLSWCFVILSANKSYNRLNAHSAGWICEILNHNFRRIKTYGSSPIDLIEGRIQCLTISEAAFYHFEAEELLCQCVCLCLSNRIISWNGQIFVLGTGLLESTESFMSKTAVPSPSTDQFPGLPSFQGDSIESLHTIDQIIVFDTNIIYDMIEEVVLLSKSCSLCFAVPFTVIDELIGLQKSSVKKERVISVLEKLENSPICALTIDGEVRSNIDLVRPCERWSDHRIRNSDDAILYGVEKHGNATLISNDVNMILKGSATRIRVLSWDEFITQFI